MTKDTRITRRVLISERDLPGFLDMLRYDQCTVLSWAREDASLFEIKLLSASGRTTGFEFTDDRWKSFGLYLKEV